MALPEVLILIFLALLVLRPWPRPGFVAPSALEFEDGSVNIGELTLVFPSGPGDLPVFGLTICTFVGTCCPFYWRRPALLWASLPAVSVP